MATTVAPRTDKPPRTTDVTERLRWLTAGDAVLAALLSAEAEQCRMIERSTARRIVGGAR